MLRNADLGSIPACAGEPKATCVRSTSVRVYPRVCGGAAVYAVASLWALGLSPRVRGSQVGRCHAKRVFGSIPACAGEPGATGAGGGIRRVYPRVCGGAVCRFRFLDLTTGLSPRVRGSLFQVDEKAVFAGSIPACAGEPRLVIRPLLLEQVYPRVCGGAIVQVVQTENPRGLSPRVRGSPSLLGLP